MSTVFHTMDKPSFDTPIEINSEAEEALWQLIEYYLDTAQRVEAVDTSIGGEASGFQGGIASSKRDAAIDLIVLLTGHDREELTENIDDIDPEEVRTLENE